MVGGDPSTWSPVHEAEPVAVENDNENDEDGDNRQIVFLGAPALRKAG